MLRNFLKAAAVIVAVPFFASLAVADETMTIGTGKAKFGANLQFWFVNDTTMHNFNNSFGSQIGTKLNMRLRRAEMKVSGTIAESTKYYLMIDPASSATAGTVGSLLRDMWIAHTVLVPELELQVGQFKQPTVAESLDPSGELMFPERSMIARIHGEQREPGVMLTYKASMWKLAASMSNGQGIGATDTDQGSGTFTQSSPNAKRLTIRGDIKPVEMLTAGAFAQFQDFSWGGTSLWGANVRLMPVEDFVIRAEATKSVQHFDNAGNAYAANTDNAVPQNGYVVDAGYQYGDWQPVARWEMAQNGTSYNNSATGTALTLGVNYYLAKHNSKIQFAYLFLNDVAGSFGAFGAAGTAPTAATANTGSYLPARGVDGGMAMLAFQAAL